MTMKKLISLLLAVVFTVTPMAVFAEEGDLGTYENPYLLSVASMTPLAITVAPGAEAYVKADSCDNTLVTVGYATNAGYFLQYGRQTVFPVADGTAELTLSTYSDIFSVFNGGETDVVVYMTLTDGTPASVGTYENPEEITLSQNMMGNLGASLTQDLEAGNEGYHYSWTAHADGYINFKIDAFDIDYLPVGWTYSVNNEAGGYYGDTHWSDDEVLVNNETVPVREGEVVTLYVNTFDPFSPWNAPEGTINLTVAFFSSGSVNFPEEITAGVHSVTLEENNQGYYYIWEAPQSGNVEIVLLGETWQYSVNIARADGSFYYGDFHWCDDDPIVPSETHTVSAGDKVTVFVSTYDPADMWAVPAGTVDWELAFVATDPVPPVEDPDEPEDPDVPEVDDRLEGYYDSGVYLSMGDNEAELDSEYLYTIYYFKPEEIGTYTLVASNGLIASVSYNGHWVTTEPSAETVTDNTVVWECTSVGQAIIIAAISGDPAINISITSEELVIVEFPWTKYENKHTPVPFVFEGDDDELLYVETFDKNVDVAVLGADGFYHLGSAYGPLLYACLSDPLMSLAGAMDYGQLKYVAFDGDTIVEKVDYNEAFAEYLACTDSTALYPLTEDLMIMFQNVGAYHGWYGSDGWVGGNLDDAWMFACYYFEQEEPAFVFGDVDGDGKAAKTDYFKLKSYLLGKDIAFDDGMFARSDIDGNGKVNKTDYFKLKSYLLGKWTPEN